MRRQALDFFESQNSEPMALTWLIHVEHNVPYNMSHNM